MLRRLLPPVTAALLSGGLLLPILPAAAKAHVAPARTESLNPFTRLAYLPAGVDPSTIRFANARLVQVASKVQDTTDGAYCEQLAFRDPGGSIACPSIRTEATVPAYEVTYSFSGQPLGSDEYAGRDFTFSVYFRPGELAPNVERALTSGKLGRGDAAAYFTVSTYRETVRRIAIDGGKSHLCEGNYVDGAWVQTDAGCTDNIRYTAIMAPSGYITVRIDRAASPAQRVGIESAK